MTTEKSSPQPAPRHTPGPWLEGRVVATGLPIKLQMYGDTIWWPREQSDAEAQANLRLMDAGPELLAACEAIVAWDEAEKAARPYEEDDGAAWRARLGACLKAFEMAKEAIAKATGGAA